MGRPNCSRTFRYADDVVDAPACDACGLGGDQADGDALRGAPASTTPSTSSGPTTRPSHPQGADGTGQVGGRLGLHRAHRMHRRPGQTTASLPLGGAGAHHDPVGPARVRSPGRRYRSAPTPCRLGMACRLAGLRATRRRRCSRTRSHRATAAAAGPGSAAAATAPAITVGSSGPGSRPYPAASMTQAASASAPPCPPTASGRCDRVQAVGDQSRPEGRAAAPAASLVERGPGSRRVRPWRAAKPAIASVSWICSSVNATRP